MHLQLRIPELQAARLRNQPLRGGRAAQAAAVPSPAIARTDLFRSPLDRRITALALPAFGTLAAEPLYLVADTAIVGRLGTQPLAGLALAASVLLFVTVAVQLPGLRHHAAGGARPGCQRPGGARPRWVCSPCGSASCSACRWPPRSVLFARPVVQLLGGEGAALDAAVTYLRISAIGVPFILLALVGAGVFRGVADLRTPLAIVFTASVVNLLLEIVAVYGLDLGIAGSAWSTVVVQVAAAAAYLLLMRRHLAAARVPPALIGPSWPP